jgi:hypothetical protein
MILYHGTDSKNLDSILARGLLPRKFTGNKVYGGEFASNDSFTYLTRWNPVAHAYSIDENSPLILKVDVDENDLYPDEDFIERELSWESIVKTGKAWEGKISEIDVSQFKDKWWLSYNVFGSVAIREVPPEKIVDHIVLDPSDFDYHCGLGAQGNQLIPNLKDHIHIADGNHVKRCIKRLEMLFNEGWDAVKKDILRERPSLALTLPKPTEQIRVRGRRLRVLLKPTYPFYVYICDEWKENFPIKFPTLDKNFSKLVQVPLNEVGGK